MKKIKASLIKRLLKISEQDLVNLALDLSNYSLSLSLILLDTYSFLGEIWHWRKEGKEGQRKQRLRRGKQDQVATIGFIASINLNVYFTS